MSVAALTSPNRLRSVTSPSPCFHHRFVFPTPAAFTLPTHGAMHLVSLRKFICPPPGRLIRQRHEASYTSSGAADYDEGREVPFRPSSLDAFLSAAEVLCIAPSLVFAAGGAIGCLLPKRAPKLFHVSSGNAFYAGQFFLLVGAVVIGVLIRQRQCRWWVSGDTGAPGGDLLGRIEKVEENIRSSATIVRGLSRQLEKLGIRFRVTRRTLRDPISETAALAQKNSETTRALVLEAKILETELKEIQKVLLAMQDQQQKQLDLILAMGKAGMLAKGEGKVSSGQDATGKTDLVSEKELQ